ncbi:MAG: hypothetical protein ACOC35_17155 [Promethearchaeia archaeon]
MGKDGNLGFEVYRLAEFSQGANSDYIRVAYEIEAPKSLNYFNWVKKIVEDSQRKDPVLIQELKEKNAVVPGQLQEIPTSEEEEAKSEDKYPEITPVVDGFNEGAAKISEVFLKDFKEQLGMWTKDMNLGVLSGSKHLKTTLTEMEEGFNFGIEKVQDWFESTLNEITEDFKEEVSGYLDQRMETQNQLKQDTQEISDQLSGNVEEQVDNKITEIMSQIEDKSTQLTDSIKKIKKKEQETNSIIEQNSETISKLKTELQDLSEALEGNLKESGESLESEFVTQMDSLKEDLSKLEQAHSDIEGISKKLKDVSMKFRNL